MAPPVLIFKLASFKQEVVCVFRIFTKMWEVKGLSFPELKQAVKRIRLQLSVIKKKKGVKYQQLGVFLELYLEQCLFALDGAPFLP